MKIFKRKFCGSNGEITVQKLCLAKFEPQGILSIFLILRPIWGWYSYKLYSYKKKCVTHIEVINKQTSQVPERVLPASISCDVGQIFCDVEFLTANNGGNRVCQLLLKSRKIDDEPSFCCRKCKFNHFISFLLDSDPVIIIIKTNILLH